MTPSFLTSLAPATTPLSPALLAGRRTGGAAYELKFLLTADQAREVERRTAAALAPDPHAGPDGAYQTTTLYCDTPALDAFFNTGPGRRRKHRLRRYGEGPVVFLERKTKWGARVRKRRTAVAPEEIASLTGIVADLSWSGHWFHCQLLRRGLRPVCLLSYDRTAFAGTTTDGPLRITLDRRLRGRPANGWHLAAVDDGPDLLAGVVIVEFKFQGGLPLIGKRWIEELRLAPGAASKYRCYLRSTGLVAGEGDDDV